MSHRSPILVTGSIRSGTTWVGRTLGTAPGVAVIHEPFNVDHPLGVFAHRWANQYAYMSEVDDDASTVEQALGDTLAFRYRPRVHLRHGGSPLRTLGMARDLPRFWYRRLFSQPRPILKDPIAMFSAEWLADRFEMDVVVMIRHPGAFAWSYQRIAEPNRLADLLGQKALMEGPLEPFSDDLERAAKSEDPIYQAATLWRVTYATARRYRERNPDWLFVRHEDLSAHPQRGFHALFQRLGLAFTERTRRFIELTTSPLNPTEAPEGKLHHLRRNSEENVTVWQRRLSPVQIGRLRGATEAVADSFYDASTWS